MMSSISTASCTFEWSESCIIAASRRQNLLLLRYSLIVSVAAAEWPTMSTRVSTKSGHGGSLGLRQPWGCASSAGSQPNRLLLPRLQGVPFDERSWDINMFASPCCNSGHHSPCTTTLLQLNNTNTRLNLLQIRCGTRHLLTKYYAGQTPIICLSTAIQFLGPNIVNTVFTYSIWQLCYINRSIPPFPLCYKLKPQ